mgnify:FL=1
MNKILMVSTLLALSACNNHESVRPSEAAKPPPPAANSAETHAKQAVQLFFKTCVATGADEKALAGVAAQGKLLLLNEAQKQEFNFEPQARQVWGAHTQEGGRFFLVSGKQYCSVKAKTADPQTIEQEMAQLAAQTADSLGVKAEKVKEEVSPDIPTAKQTAYALQPKGQPNEILLVVHTNSNPQAPAQAALNFHWVPVK